MLNKLEKKLGKYALPHLMNYIIGGYVIGYLLMFGQTITNWSFIGLMTLNPYNIIHQFQFWRVITWVLIPPQDNLIFAIIMMFFYWQLGNALERTWGTFRFNVYIFGGILFTVIGAFVLYGVLALVYGYEVASLGGLFSTSYINMSIFLAFAVCYPDMEVMLYFIIPIKMKWMAIVYAVLVGYTALMSGWVARVAIIASLLNFLIFFLMTRDYRKMNPKERARKARWKAAYGSGGNGFGPSGASYQQEHPGQQGQGYRHKCAICGRTDVSNPELEFRYCSKCNGNYEYCNEHLFTHPHVK
ncbi:MAG: hypothetical protein K6G04_08720 [Lachnospiraceae bacterium]|nr:hypothetical protein [Lachnospiraceae bacterium]